MTPTQILEYEIRLQRPNAVIHDIWFDDEHERWVLQLDGEELYFDVGSDDDSFIFCDINGDAVLSFAIPANWPTE